MLPLRHEPLDRVHEPGLVRRELRLTTKPPARGHDRCQIGGSEPSNGLARDRLDRRHPASREADLNVVEDDQSASDLTMFDVTEVPCEIGDTITLIGSDGDDAITVSEIGRLGHFSPYEVLTSLRSRLPRRYFTSDKR